MDVYEMLRIRQRNLEESAVRVRKQLSELEAAMAKIQSQIKFLRAVDLEALRAVDKGLNNVVVTAYIGGTPSTNRETYHSIYDLLRFSGYKNVRVESPEEFVMTDPISNSCVLSGKAVDLVCSFSIE